MGVDQTGHQDDLAKVFLNGGGMLRNEIPPGSNSEDLTSPDR